MNYEWEATSKTKMQGLFKTRICSKRRTKAATLEANSNRYPGFLTVAASDAFQKITCRAKYAIGRQRIRKNVVELYTQAKFRFEDPNPSPQTNPSPEPQHQPPAPAI